MRAKKTHRWNPTAGFIRRVSEIEDENENDDEDDIQERLSRSESDPLEQWLRPKKPRTIGERLRGTRNAPIRG
jgi:hypothetical protein